MAAQEPERKFNICDRCFATVPLKSGFCPECGAPVGSGAPESSDSAVYGELARANLLRMRGEYRLAKEQCLDILKRLPNNASANTLLGDIAAETGELEQAIQWYELALDLTPDSESVRTKVEAIRKRQMHQEAVETAKKLGIPLERSKSAWFVAGLIAVMALVALAVHYFDSKTANTGQTDSTTYAAPIDARQASLSKGSVPASTPSSDATIGDLTVARRMESASALGSYLLAVLQDPRLNEMTVVYRCPATDDYRVTGARLARTALDVSPDTLKVVLRCMSSGRLVYCADVVRARLVETTMPSWTSQNPDPSAWVDHVLTNEWDESGRARAAQNKEASKQPADQPAPTDQGSATPGDSQTVPPPPVTPSDSPTQPGDASGGTGGDNPAG